MAWQLTDALAYAHLHQVVHRDLDAANVLLSESLVAKLGGFKYCTVLGRPADPDLELDCARLAPESLLDNEFSELSDM